VARLDAPPRRHRVPEAEVDVPRRRQAVQRKAALPHLAADRADPHRQDADLAVQELEELRRPRDRDVDVLDDALAVQPAPAGRPIRDLPARGGAHPARVGARIQPLRPEQPAHQRVVGAEVARAPEPVGVPAPQVVRRGQVVVAARPQGLPVDVLVAVVAAPGRVADEAADAEHLLAAREHHAVDEIGRAGAGVLQGIEELVRGGEVMVPHVHGRQHRQRGRPHAHRIAERAIRIRKAEEEVALLVVRRTDDKLAVRQQHFDLQQRVVHEPVPERRRLDADARGRAPDRDRLQLRHHGRHAPLQQGRRDEILVRRAAFGVHPAGVGIVPQYVMQRSQVDPVARRGPAIAKQVRGRLRQRERAGRRLFQLRRRLGHAQRMRRQVMVHTGSPASSGSSNGSRRP
jgi:hypothetical protein